MKLKALFVGLVFAATLGMQVHSVAQAATPPNLDRLVSETPATWTPNIDLGTFETNRSIDREVWSFAEGTGSIMYACGKFERVYPPGYKPTPQKGDEPNDNQWDYRGSVFGFYTAGTNRGKLTSFNPRVTYKGGMGTVHKCIMGPGRTSIILVGQFDSVLGQPAANLARVVLPTSTAPTPKLISFGSTNDTVTDIEYRRGGHYFLFGRFSVVSGHTQPAIATVKLDGTYDSYFKSKISGYIADDAGNSKDKRTNSYRGAVSPDGKELVAIVNSSSIDGKKREQIAKWDLKKSGAVLQKWKPAKAYNGYCDHARVLRDVVFSVAGGSFYTVSTGGAREGRQKGLCDQTIRWATKDRGTDVKPKWFNRTCGDTLHAVAVTSAAIYAQGHNKCTEKTAGGPKKSDFSDRNGIFALTPKKGSLKAWRSDQLRCDGGKTLHVSNQTGFPQGMWSGMDCGGGILFRPV